MCKLRKASSDSNGKPRIKTGLYETQVIAHLAVCKQMQKPKDTFVAIVKVDKALMSHLERQVLTGSSTAEYKRKEVISHMQLQPLCPRCPLDTIAPWGYGTLWIARFAYKQNSLRANVNLPILLITSFPLPPPPPCQEQSLKGRRLISLMAGYLFTQHICETLVMASKRNSSTEKLNLPKEIKETVV
ncbi:hypothetical protein Nmel_004167 [Mimus melanotis]